LKAPFPYFGGKSTVAPLIWERLGADVSNYCEPFFGSGAVLLSRPRLPDTVIETVNDKDGFVCNVFRAIRDDPATVARYADHMVNENDLHARHLWLVERKDALISRLEADPDYYDAKIAGWWVWGISCWIGGEFCSGKGPWRAIEDANGIFNLVHLGDAGRGVNRRLVYLGDAGRGVNRRLVHLGDAGRGHEICPQCGEGLCGLYQWMEALAQRLRRVRVCCGDWSRIMGPTPTWKQGLTGIYLDPPYSAEAGRDTVYSCDDMTVAHDVRKWCLENGDNPLLRIALSGYVGEGHEALEAVGWDVVDWKAHGGYGTQGNGRGRENSNKERIWFSPHALKPKRAQQGRLF
jgi:hypothetical protein